MSAQDGGDMLRWFLGGPQTRPDRISLLCLPHAGGAASSYRAWLCDLTPHVDVLPIQLPGRENRMSVPFAESLDALIADLTAVIARAELTDLALFGHSMGAVLATRLCTALEQSGRPVRHLFVSGHFGTGPWPADARLSVSPTATDEELLGSLAVLDPAAAPRYGHAELAAMILPILRADLRLLHGISLAGVTVDAPVTALAGTDDPVVVDLAGWAGVSRTDHALYRLPGNHFYLASQGPELSRIVCHRLGLPVGVP
ncbi:alpha/beta fold hydrolase [Plantactinospora sp. B6F1]|uniref:thioesterase II family protein n=1 Tax=Plantactinospora sp. B6F1 TaxID=3158971 RepID=UPI0032D9505A